MSTPPPSSHFSAPSKVENTPIDAPFDKNGVYFFTVPKFHRTGTFKLVFHVTPAPLFYVDTSLSGEAAAAAVASANAAAIAGATGGDAVGGEGGEDGGNQPPQLPQPPKRTFHIKPLEFTVKVCAMGERGRT